MACTTTNSRQQPLFAVRRFVPKPYETGSFYDMLERYGELLIKAEDFPRTSLGEGGVDGICVVLKSKLVLIQKKHSWSDEETVRRARTDLEVKACLGLGVEQEGPSQPTLSRHRKRMEELELDCVYHERFVALLKTLELVKEEEAVLIDSVPVAGAGQVQDSYNLLAGGIRQGLRRLAQCTGERGAEVARRLDLDLYVERGIKGKVAVDWETTEGPRKLLERLVTDAQRLQGAITDYFAKDQPVPVVPDGTDGAAPSWAQGGTGEAPHQVPAQPSLAATAEAPPASVPEPLYHGGAAQSAEPAAPAAPEAPRLSDLPQAPQLSLGSAGEPGAAACAQSSDVADQAAKEQALRQATEQLTTIVAHDVDFGPDGQVRGIRQEAAKDRPISITDPDMRHGRKSASVLIAGYKAQVLASLLGFILMIEVFRANGHDGENLGTLLGKLYRRHKLSPKAAIGDHAYGTIANHAAQQQTSTELIARMARPTNGGRYTKDQFTVDWEQRTMTCPAGQVIPLTRLARCDKERGWEFQYPLSLCGNCPHKAQCVSPKAKDKGRTVFLMPEKELLIRRHLLRREEPEFQELLALRPLIERVIAGFAQCGGKAAHRMGRDHVQFDANLSGLAYNLRRLGSLLREQLAVAARLEAEAQRLLFLYLLRALLSYWLWSRRQPLFRPFC